jgi:hypothetical protein
MQLWRYLQYGWWYPLFTIPTVLLLVSTGIPWSFHPTAFTAMFLHLAIVLAKNTIQQFVF